MRGAVRALTTAGPYRVLAGRQVLPWALQGLRPAGRSLEVGAGSGAMAGQLLRRGRAVAGAEGRLVATGCDQVMVTASGTGSRPGGPTGPARAADRRQDRPVSRRAGQ